MTGNPAVADWFFYHRITKYIDAFYVNVLGVTDYWYRFEWQHRGSPHVHGVAWLPDAPDVEQLLSASTDGDDEVFTAAEVITGYADKIVTTMNPAIATDGSNADSAAPLPKTNPHVCNKSYSDIEDFTLDLVDLIATCQRHTKCSTAYCLRTRNKERMVICAGWLTPPLTPTGVWHRGGRGDACAKNLENFQPEITNLCL